MSSVCVGTRGDASMFVLLEDGISYVVDPTAGICNDSGGVDGLADVRPRHVDAVIAAAEDCPGECIFIDVDEEGPGAADH